MIIKPLAKIVLRSGWYWVPAFFWIIASLSGLGFSVKGFGLSALLAIAWFIAVYATFGTALANAVDDDKNN